MEYLKKSFSVGMMSLKPGWAEDWDRVFAKCRKHPKYKALRKPKSNCPRCVEIWLAKNK